MKLLLVAAVAMAAAIPLAAPADATPRTDQALSAIESANGHYVWGAASLQAADCSGLVSVAQTLAMGEPPHRLGDTRSLLAGQWPNAVPGASPGDAFIIGVSPAHMAASINGVNIESGGGAFRVGPNAASPWDRQFTRVYHIDPAVL